MTHCFSITKDKLLDAFKEIITINIEDMYVLGPTCVSKISFLID